MKRRGRVAFIAAGILAAAVLLLFLVLSDEVRIQVHLYRLRSDARAVLGSLAESPEGSARRKAVERFLAGDPGREKLLTLVMDDLAGQWGRPLAGGSNAPSFQELYQALCGMRNASDGQWVLWTEVRLPPQMAWSQCATSISPSFARREALILLLDALGRGWKAGASITLPGYPRLRFHVEPFREGLERYESSLKAQGHSIEQGLFWSEILSSWPEMLESRTLLPWTIRVERTGGG